MFRRYLLPVLALGLMVFAVYHVMSGEKGTVPSPPPVDPARNPYGNAVAGAGIVEAQTENIAVGSPLPGIVAEVFVERGQRVAPGDRLFRLDDRQLLAEKAMRQAAVEAAEAELERLERQPRPEQLPISQAAVDEARARVVQLEDEADRIERAAARNAVSPQERIRAEQQLKVARQQFARAEGELALLKAGAWEPDKAVARAAVAQARAQLEATTTELDRLVVKALVPGEVLQINVRPGEFVGAPAGQPLIVLGDTETLHVRVDIDENDIPRFVPGTPARAVLRGTPEKEFRLRFVRVEPYVIPKRSLTGDNTERVDTRVLQVIYAFEPTDDNVYVGQQLDVFTPSRNNEDASEKPAEDTPPNSGSNDATPAMTRAAPRHPPTSPKRQRRSSPRRWSPAFRLSSSSTR